MNEYGFPTLPDEVTLTCEEGTPAFVHWRCDILLERTCTVPLTTIQPDGWAFDGNVKAPTLTPSIKCFGCGWHGYIRNGKKENA